MLENISMFLGSCGIGFRMFLTSGNYQIPSYRQILHVSRDFLFFPYSFSDALTVFLKYFLTPGQSATRYSLGFSTLDQWIIINTGMETCIITCHSSGSSGSGLWDGG